MQPAEVVLDNGGVEVHVTSFIHLCSHCPQDNDYLGFFSTIHLVPEVYISPKINISARTLKMALHKNPVMHCDRVVIFLHGSQIKAFSLHN